LLLRPDRDEDGLPDDWEADHGFDPADAGDAGLDADGDGVSNGAEFAAGTDERNAQSFLRIDGIRRNDATGWHVQFTAVSNRTYSLQTRDLQGDANWKSVADIVAAPTNRPVEIIRASEVGPGRLLRLATPRGR
jgi:hypothetical protein